jgi:hypothetical protein
MNDYQFKIVKRWSTDYCIANGMDRPAQTTVYVRAWPASETLLETLREHLHLTP